MTDPSPTGSSLRFLADRWAPRLIPLDAFLERHEMSGFVQFILVMVALVVAIVLFSVIGQAAVMLLLLAESVPPGDLLDAQINQVDTYGASIMLGNAIGQFLGLGGLAWLLARGHSTRPLAFMRLRAPDAGITVLTLLGFVALFPVMQWVLEVNQSIQLPDVLEQLDALRAELLKQILEADTSVFFNLSVLAITPALCEELLFRGYAQRQLERSVGVVLGIVLCGLFFGAYHFALKQVLALSALGIYLAYITWRTGSLWPAILVHFANNGFAVLLGAYAASRSDLDLEDIESMNIPDAYVVVGVVVFVVLMVVLHKLAQARLAERPSLSLSATESAHD